jgi:CubicO group peptidase (beta-lactamase class C family)
MDRIAPMLICFLISFVILIINPLTMKSFKRIAVCVLLTSFFACSSNKEEKSDKNQYSNFVVESYKPLESIMNQSVLSNKIPGGVGLVFEKGEMVFHKAFGFKKIEEQVPFEVDDIFRIASMTKPITAVAAMILYDEGKFQLDDPVSKYIPEFGNLEILKRINYDDSTFLSYPATKPMTIRHLFTHSSGLFYGFDNDSLAILLTKAGVSEGFEERDILLEDNVKRLAKLPIMHEPGERYTYGVGIDVLGRLVEIWSGMPLDKFFSEKIFNPLGMKDTHFYLPEEKYSRLVPVYMSTDSGVALTDYPNILYPVRGAKKFLSGGADLSSTAYDYYLFCRMMLQKGELNGERILKSETVDLITSTHLETGDNDMGLGFGLLSAKTEVDIARSVGSYTWGGFFTTTFWIDPKEEVIAVLMLQVYPFVHWEVQKDFEDMIYEIIENSSK